MWDLPGPGLEAMSPALAGGFLTTAPPGKSPRIHTHTHTHFFSYEFIYFWLRWVFVAVCELFSSCGERGLLFVAALGFLIVVASLVAEHGR